MTDIVTPSVRSQMMAGIRRSDTRPEREVRSGLWHRGFRFRLHAKLPGRPDVYLPRWNTVIFVHGCYWHAHIGCKYFRIPGSNGDFWREKFAKNKVRDAQAVSDNLTNGLQVITIWECATRFDLNSAIDVVEKLIRTSPRPAHHEISVASGKVVATRK